MVGGSTSDHPRLHCGRLTAVVSHGQGIPSLGHTVMVPHLLKHPTLVPPIPTGPS